MAPKRLERILSIATIIVVCFALGLLLNSCVGWGDVFAERRAIVGSYFLMTSDGSGTPQYYLFVRGRSGGIAGAIKAIGWSREYILVQTDSFERGWVIFPIDPRQYPVPTNEADLARLEQSLVKSIKLRSPEEVWRDAR